jgi:hypothetical protein
MVGGAGRLLAGVFLAGLVVAAQVARGDAPPLASVDVDAYPDRPAGLRYGSLLYHASLVSGTVWDSNIFSSKENVVADRIFYVRPGLTVSTLDPNYRFTLRTAVESLDYDISPAESRTDAKAELRGSIRMQRDSELLVGLVAARVTEPRSVQRRDLPEDAAEPVLHNQYSAWVGLRRIYNPVISTTTVAVDNDNYFNVRSNAGTSINLQYLDRDAGKITQETDLRLSHRLLLFSRQRATMTTYRNEPGFIQRDSIKFETVNGIEVGFTPLVKGRFSFHFAEEHFWANVVESDPERIYSAELAWWPLRNCGSRRALTRDFGGVSFDLDSVGGRRTRADVVLEYDITRQLFFRAGFAHLHANEASIGQGAGRLENTYVFKASLGYECPRFWSVYLDYAYERREANFETTSSSAKSSRQGSSRGSDATNRARTCHEMAVHDGRERSLLVWRERSTPARKPTGSWVCARIAPTRSSCFRSMP